MSERILPDHGAELEFAKRHVAAISSFPGGVVLDGEYTPQPEEREGRTDVVQVPVAQPPVPSASSSTAASNTGDSFITLTIKSLRPPLSFTLASSPTASIGELKAALYAQSGKEGAPSAEAQRWLYKGKAMADERLLKEYEGVKDGDLVHLSVKAGTAPSTAPAAPVPGTADTSATTSQPKASTTTPTADSSSTSKPTLHTPFNFSGSNALSSSSGSNGAGSRARTTSSSSLTSPSGGNRHARVPSITLTTDFSNFDNLAGDAAETSARSPGSPGGSASPPFGSPGFSPAAPGSPSGASTPRSAPGTPMTGGGRSRGPSISIPIDLDNVELMNPLSSDRKHPVGLSPLFIDTVRDPKTWNDILAFLDKKFVEKGAVAPEAEEGEHSDETKRIFETWLGASKDWLSASDVARIRDRTGVWGMAGR